VRHVISVVVVLVVAAAALVVRLRTGRTRSPLLLLGTWIRRRLRSSQMAGHGPLPYLERVLGTTGLVASREVRQRLRGRTFRVVTLLILVAVAAAIVIPTLTNSGSAKRIGVNGSLAAGDRAAVLATAAELKTRVTLVPEPSPAALAADVRSGRVDFGIAGDQRLVVDKALPTAGTSVTATLVRALSTVLGIRRAQQAARLSASQAAALLAARPLPVVSLQPTPGNSNGRNTAMIGLVLLFVMLTQYLTWTLIGVMEEKSSRVVEVLLATVRPAQLLGGKVLGIGLMVFAQAALIVAFALALAAGVGSSFLHGTAPAEVVSILVWLVLGYAFFCWVYAAAGSMAERQDQVQSLALPLSLPILFGYVTSLTVVSSGSASALIKVLAYLPPTAPFAMPTLVALNAVAWWQFGLAAVLSILSTIGMARLAGGIYRRAVLRTGRRVRLREALSPARG
jgi:ABC-2 type transport system permease protein